MPHFSPLGGRRRFVVLQHSKIFIIKRLVIQMTVSQSELSVAKCHTLPLAKPPRDPIQKNLFGGLALLWLCSFGDLAIRSPNGGFVPDPDESRSFVIKQIRGFVFKKALSYQPSALQKSAFHHEDSAC